MRKQKHLWHYIPLLGILIFGVISFSIFSYDKSFQAFVAVVMGIFYVLWGVIHHYAHKDLSLMVVVEYVLVSSLGLIIIFSLLFNA